MTSVLERILESTRAEVERRRAQVPVGSLEPLSRAPGLFSAALRGPTIAVIAEYKRRSPSAGAIGEGLEVAAVVAAYERGGAAALSVLTEGPNFGGSLEDLRVARATSGLPILRKDFVIDSYQLHEAAAAGADAVLLIAAALDQTQLAALHGGASDLGLEVLVEVHDREELERAAVVGARIIGINNRDLRDFSVDPGRTLALAAHAPPGALLVSESGIDSRERLAALAGAGIDAALIGESLMRAPDPAAALRALCDDL